MSQRIILLICACVFWATTSYADEIRTCSPEGIATGGYDLVSYHHESGPKMGLDSHVFELDGLSYRFASASNLEKFEYSPQKYLPVYQGWCAATLAMGRLACPDYTNFKIEDDSLLFFELAGFTNGRTIWNSDPTDFRKRADTNFLKFLR
ncbi:MAG: YHS domain-containing protein [Halioglobus sp.]|jgi:YHS domain-containing protein